ncbi:helix-turn-helix domain-containing protein [Aestuariivirga sp. YIM B02566]|uniref:XRE family transcriptional regulator n=1 Tax=Taklimakanibacter albus TaxID=2800327 RepID=A0ACC5RCS0_9HYPH|nr:XRE family transcriptional regulator [Aestuariivirga sp. YIM B02566]MBK1870408.1 XRE family transcriptional regulator [Aestuariivirga sp. YIM B02566]
MRNIRAIRNEVDYDWALAEIAHYFENQPAPGTVAADRFDVLASLIEAYEAKNWPIEPTDPVEAIEYRMEISGYTQKDLSELIGSRSRASEILKRKRPLTMQMAHKLSVEWNIPAEVLLKPYHLDTR